MASKWRFVSPKDYNVNTSASWFFGRKASGVPCLQYKPAAGADTNVIIQIPLADLEIDEGRGQTRVLRRIHVCQQLSATSAGVVPLISAAAAVYEVNLAAGKFITTGLNVTSAGTAAGVTKPNTATSAGFVNDASGTAWTGSPSYQGSAIADVANASSYVDIYTNIRAKTPQVGETYDHAYQPRLGLTQTCLEISASVDASAAWEHYGTFLEYL